LSVFEMMCGMPKLVRRISAAVVGLGSGFGGTGSGPPSLPLQPTMARAPAIADERTRTRPCAQTHSTLEVSLNFCL